MKQRKQPGFTLIELLIALLVFSVGVVGLAGLHAIALSNSRKSYYANIATSGAADMAERLWANQTGARNSNYDRPLATLHSGCYTTVGCNAQEMAENDFAEWRAEIAGILPNGTASICIDSLGTATCDGLITGGEINYVISITWSGDSQTRSLLFPIKIDK